MRERITFVGLDVHRATIAVCVAEAGRDGEVRFVGEIPNAPAALDKLAARLSRGGRSLRFAHDGNRTNLAAAQARGTARVLKEAAPFAGNVAPIIREIQASGITSLRGLAVALNARGVTAACAEVGRHPGGHRAFRRW